MVIWLWTKRKSIRIYKTKEGISVAYSWGSLLRVFFNWKYQQLQVLSFFPCVRSIHHPIVYHHYHHHRCCGHHGRPHHHNQTSDYFSLLHTSATCNVAQARRHQTYHHHCRSSGHQSASHHLSSHRYDHRPNRTGVPAPNPKALRLQPLPPRRHLRGRRRRLQLQVPRRTRRGGVWERWVLADFSVLFACSQLLSGPCIL